MNRSSESRHAQDRARTDSADMRKGFEIAELVHKENERFAAKRLRRKLRGEFFGLLGVFVRFGPFVIGDPTLSVWILLGKTKADESTRSLLTVLVGTASLYVVVKLFVRLWRLKHLLHTRRAYSEHGSLGEKVTLL